MSKKFDPFKYTFLQSCECCDNKPVLKTTGMCGPCTYGEADSMWDWLEGEYKGKELKAAKKYVRGLLKECWALGITFEEDINSKLISLLEQKEV